MAEIMTIYCVIDMAPEQVGTLIAVYAYKSQAKAYIKKEKEKDSYNAQYLEIKSFSLRGIK